MSDKPSHVRTGEEERFVAGEGSALMRYEHLHRYALAAGFSGGRRVLDLACGSGYGTRLLRAAGAQVTALDLDAAVARAAAPSRLSRRQLVPGAAGVGGGELGHV